MGDVGEEYRYVEQGTGRGSGASVEHITEVGDSIALCGAEPAGSHVCQLQARISGGESVYGMMDGNSYICPDCRSALLERLGLPETREEANAMLPDGREVF